MPIRIPDASVVVNMILEVRRASGVLREQFSDMRIGRLLRTHSFDVSATAAAVVKHQELAGWFDASKAVSSDAEDALRSKRFQYMGLNTEQNPIVVLNFMCGQFTNVPGGVDTLLEAYVMFLRQTTARVKAERRDREELEFVLINIGGPPPTDFVEEMGHLRTIDFPEHIGCTVDSLGHESLPQDMSHIGVNVRPQRRRCSMDGGSSDDSVESQPLQAAFVHVRRPSDGSDCSTVDSDQFGQILQHSPILAKETPAHLDCNNASAMYDMYEAANYLATLAEQSRLKASLCNEMWRQSQWPGQELHQADVAVTALYNDGASAKVSNVGNVKPSAKASRGISGAQRRKHKKLLAKPGEASDVTACTQGDGCITI